MLSTGELKDLTVNLNLNQTNVSIDQLLSLLEGTEPESIHLNHVLVEEGMEEMPFYARLDHLPSFTVTIGGFVEVEMYMDMTHHRVVRILVRQTAMTFEELDRNGEVLPNLTINCLVLPRLERERLDALARGYIKKGKILDKARVESLLMEYVGKAMFCPKRYPGMVASV